MQNKIWNPQYKILDHWRGIAALWVMMFHGFAGYDNPANPFHPIVQILRAVAINGRLGVNIFFVVSGYCIAASAYKLAAKNGRVTAFLENRMWRIFPTYWSAFIVAIAINLISTIFNKTSIASNLPSSWQFWVAHIFLAQPYLKIENYVGVYWTLSVEVGFYLIVAILLIISKCVNQKVAIFSGLVLGFASVFMPLNIRWTFLIFWCEFICGSLVFSALLAKSQQKEQQHKISILLICIMALFGLWVNWHLKATTLWVSAMFALVLYFLYGIDSKIDSISQLNWLKFIGVMSYSLYLIHVPFQENVINLGLRFIPINSPLMLPLQILGWIVAITVAYIFYRLIEKPLCDRRHQRNKNNSSI
jgi:peptidoglycan/LPS O-acetylase OafA/YrhL